MLNVVRAIIMWTGIVTIICILACAWYAVKRVRRHDTPRERREKAVRDLVVVLRQIDSLTLVSIKEMANGHMGLSRFEMMDVPGKIVVRVVDAVLIMRSRGGPCPGAIIPNATLWDAEIERRIGDIHDG